MVKGRVLDAACGCGYGSKILHDAGNKVVGVDFYPLAVEWATTRFPGPEYLCADISDRPWSGGFDWIVSLETIEHLKYPVPVLKAFREADCRLVVSTPNEELYKFRPEKFAKDHSPHFRHYTPKEFDDLLAGVGFKVVSRHCQVDKCSEVTPGTDGIFLVYVCD